LDRAVVEMTAPTDKETVARGEYLYNYTLICWSCHGSEGSYTPDEPQAGGRVFDLSEVGPPGKFGIVYASNITSCSVTGIGAWSDGELVRSIREGLDNEGHTIFVIMEAEWWKGLSDEDVLALVAYVRTFPPVVNEVPHNQLTFVAKALQALGIVGPQPAITSPIVAPPKGPTVEYGEYLVYHSSMCVGCHTPRNPNNGQFDLSRPFAGGLFPYPEEGFISTGSNLTPDMATGIGDWTEEQFITSMRSGLRPDDTVMFPFMPWPWFGHWSEEDLKATWLYLRSLEPDVHEIAPSELIGVAATGTGVEHGEALYTIYCVACHGKDGTRDVDNKGFLKSALRQINDDALMHIIAEGLDDTIRMPGFGETLTTEQISDLIEFLRSWGRK
jgi:mono/diheme cytochrome c family protein